MKQTPKIVIVEDEEVTRELFATVLEEDEGYEVITTPNGYGLIELIERERPDVIILDIALGTHDGLDLLQDIRKRFYDIPVIMFTAYSRFKFDSRAISADYYVTKGTDWTELKAKIRMCLEGGIPTAGPLTKGEVLKRIGSKIKWFLNEHDEESPPSKDHPRYRGLVSYFEGLGYFSYCSKEEVDSLFSADCEDLVRDLRMVEKLVREWISTHGLVRGENVADLLYEKAGRLSVLSFQHFKREVERVTKDTIRDFVHFGKRIDQIKEDIYCGHFASVPIDALKIALMHKPETDGSDLTVADIVMSEIRHDFKNGLRSLSLFLDWLQEKVTASSLDATATSNLVRKVSEVSATCSELVSINERLHDMRFFAVVPHYKRINVKSFLERLLKDLDAPGSKNLEVELECDFLPETVTDPNLLGVALRQVIQNAVNAIDPGSKGWIKVSAKTTSRPEQITFVVEDNGHGVPRELLGRVFKPEFRYKKKGHSGMGLRLARLACQALGGAIKLDSEPGVGTRVEITIPLET